MNHTLKELVDSKYELTSVKDIVSTDLLWDTQDQLLKILVDYQHNLFSGKVSKAKIPPHKSLLKPDATPQYACPYTIPESIKEFTKRELDWLMREDIIWKTGSTPWGAPCFVIAKKNGQPRMVVDYRHLNKQKIRHTFPMPKV